MPRRLEAMRSGRLHVAGVNTGGNPIAVELRRLRSVRNHGGQNGTFGYEMEIIVPADSPIKTPADLKGKRLAFTAHLEFRLQGAISDPEGRIQSVADATSSRYSPASTTIR